MIGKKKVIFVPGYYVSSPTEPTDWPAWLGKELEKNGFDFYYMSMPDPAYPEVNAWVDFLLNQNFEIDENTYLVGHSLGCITALRFLEKLPEGSVLGGCILISGFCTMPKIPILSDFCFLPLDFTKVKSHSQEFVSVVSDNDHLIPNELSQELSNKLGARTIVEHNKGHFITGTKEINSVLNCLLEMSQVREKLSLK